MSTKKKPVKKPARKKKVTKKKVSKKKPDLRGFSQPANWSIYGAKVVLASHGFEQTKDGNIKMTANNDGTYSLQWSCKFEKVDPK